MMDHDLKHGGGNRTPAKELEFRIDQVEQLLLLGTQRKQAIALVAEKFAVSKRTALRYVNRVYDRWRSSAEFEDTRTRQERREEQRLRLRKVLAKAWQSENFRAILRVEELLARIDGTFAADRVELSGKDGGSIDFRSASDEDIQRILTDAGLEVDDKTIH